MFLSLRDIAEGLNINYNTLRSMHHRNKLPPPTVLVGSPNAPTYAAWSEETIQTWAEKKGLQWTSRQTSTTENAPDTRR